MAIKMYRLLLLFIVMIFVAGCSPRAKGGGVLDLQLQFEGLKETYQQGIIKVDWVLENTSKKNIPLKEWRKENFPPNVVLLCKPVPSNEKFRPLPDTCLLSKKVSGDVQILKPSEVVRHTDSFVLNVKPGRYLFSLQLDSESSVCSSASPVIITKGKIPDLRK